MKTKTFLALFCLLCISSGFSSCQRHSSDQWKLVWEDNFDQKTGFDPQVWSKIPRGKSDWNNYMTDFDSCFDMRDGNMVLRGIINYSPAQWYSTLSDRRNLHQREKSIQQRTPRNTRQTERCTWWVASHLDAPDRCSLADGWRNRYHGTLNHDTIAYQTIHTNYT